MMQTNENIETKITVGAMFTIFGIVTFCTCIIFLFIYFIITLLCQI